MPHTRLGREGASGDDDDDDVQGATRPTRSFRARAPTRVDYPAVILGTMPANFAKQLPVGGALAWDSYAPLLHSLVHLRAILGSVAASVAVVATSTFTRWPSESLNRK